MQKRVAIDGGAWCDVCYGGRWIKSCESSVCESKLIPCPKCRADFEQKRAERMSRLVDDETTYMLDDVREDVHGKGMRHTLERFARGVGMAIFVGPPGTGKSFLLRVVANEARKGKLSVIVTSASELLGDLRESYDADASVSYSELFRQVKHVDVLIVDELEKLGSKTTWAECQIHDLIDARYRRCASCATLAATNDFSALAVPVRSRFGDGRKSKVIQMQSVDIRVVGIERAASEKKTSHKSQEVA